MIICKILIHPIKKANAPVKNIWSTKAPTIVPNKPLVVN